MSQTNVDNMTRNKKVGVPGSMPGLLHSVCFSFSVGFEKLDASPYFALPAQTNHTMLILPLPL